MYPEGRVEVVHGNFASLAIRVFAQARFRLIGPEEQPWVIDCCTACCC